MPFDGSGNFTRSYNFTADRNAAIKIQAPRVDGEFDNFSTAMNSTFLRSGVVAMAGNLKMGANSITGLASGSLGAPCLQFNADATTGYYLVAAGSMGFVMAGTERLRINTNGASIVGALLIGNAVGTPRTTLDVGGITSVRAAFEDAVISATAISGTIQIDVKTAAVVVLDSNAAGNFVFNIRGDGTTSLDALMAVGQALTLVVEVPQGATAYYCTSITVDSAAPSQTKWFGGAPTNGNVSSIDVYSITVIKKAAATFYVRAAQTAAA